MRREMPEPPDGGRRRGPTLRQLEWRGETIHYLNVIGEDEFPFAPAWCLSKERLIVALFPQTIKGILAEDESGSDDSLADSDAVRDALSGGDESFSLVYHDPQTLLRIFYPAAQMLAQIGLSEMQREGLDLDIGVLPSARAFDKYLRPGVSTVGRSSRGFVFTRRQTLPVGGGLTTIAPLWTGVAARLTMQNRSVAVSRVAAVQDMNTFKQVALAMHNYHATTSRFPSAVKTTRRSRLAS